MVLTSLEARVEPEREAELLEAYEEAGRGPIDEGLERSYLARGRDDPHAWRILTFWQSREALKKMRESGQTPRGVLIFQAAGATPQLSVFDVAATIPTAG